MYKNYLEIAISKIETKGQKRSRFTLKDGKRSFIAEVYKNQKEQSKYSFKLNKVNGFNEDELKGIMERSIVSAICTGIRIYILEDRGPQCTLLPNEEYFKYNYDNITVECEASTLHVEREARYIQTNILKCEPDALLQNYYLYEIL